MSSTSRIVSLLVCILAFSKAVELRLPAQTVPSVPSDSTGKSENDTVEMSPFVVESTEGDDRYLASSTLAGTRVKTDLKDVASALSVVTSQFLQDVGATNNQTLLEYTTNTEVGGAQGNYAGVGNTFVVGITEGANLINPNANTRVRGLDSADNTRDYFKSDIPWDSFNTGRIDLQRGPNSILFGIGSPAGIINASINTATFRDSASVQNRVGSFGSLRDSFDINRVLLTNQLSIRVAGLDDDAQYREDPAYNHDRRIFGALRWDPKLFETDSAHTTIRANFERGEVTSNNPRVLPPTDRIEGFFAPDGMNRTAIDSFWANSAHVAQYEANKPPLDGVTPNYWLQQYENAQVDGPLFVYGNLNSPSTPTSVYQRNQTLYFGIDSTGARDSTIAGASFGDIVGLGGYGTWAVNKQMQLGNVPGVEAADKGFYKDKSISDPSIFDFYNHLIDGPNKVEKQNWTAYNLALEQTFFNNRLGFQAVYDRQDYRNFAESNLGDPFISVDVAANLNGYSWADTGVKYYNGTGTPGNNPNAGRAYTGGAGTGTSNDTRRESIRFMGTGELRATDYLPKSWLTDLLGRHVITALLTRDRYDDFSTDWLRYGTGLDYGEVLGFGGGGNPDLGNNTDNILNGSRVVGWKTYLSAPLFSATQESGIHLQPITSVQSPSGTTQVTYFDSHWKWPLDPSDPNYVNPAAPYTLTNNADPSVSTASTQSENPANYVGWRTVTTRILNADQGDRAALTTDATKIEQRTNSRALTWQGYVWDDTIVATVGWRRDTQKQLSGAGANDPVTGAASLNFGLNPLDPATGVSTGDTKSWGVVVHEPKFLRNKLPLGTNLSVFYDDGRNERVENRYGFSGNPLPNAQGQTKDYGVMISTLNDRLQFKATWYKTTVDNANISSVTSGASTLGNYQYEISSLEGWGTASALMDLAGFAGQAPGSDWYWNWALSDHNFDPTYDNPSSPAFLNDPSTAKEKAAVQSWLAQMQPQSWYNAFNIPVDVAKAKAGDYANAVAGWSGATGYITGVNPLGGNKINGSFPTGTVDNQSKGIEFELIGQPTKNLNVSINASKQTAAQIALGQDLVAFIEAQHEKFESPAGDLRLWYAGDQTLRDYYNQGPWAAYQFQVQTNGKMVSEMSPWRVNAVANYTFDRGFLKGANAGGGYRWQDGEILGYLLNDTKDNLDINRPVWGKPQTAIDLWAGYHRKITRTIDWRIQLNLRDVGQKPHLIPISIEPDGSPANYRIAEGQTWELTNTFSF